MMIVLLYCCYRTYALKRGMVGASGTASTGGTEDSMLLPLWGQICCKLEVEPECVTEARITDFINVRVSYGNSARLGNP